ncbi:NAD(P)H-dependent glycerol-3-phosphate dehydrogenase [Calycomorphotria hydatis]|uniref:Glycerol-3-phosphate dehydrogenase [NAD(P)+] n=1 Tax=Calycomorphotria hydatis TaxID=2528027 RepID=A0A517T785_9PLAN|nr:NAD(P)H-dependent glycerol-3-phosphate dehydrogenase [Calycomorphotria hydatis]QDT64229.1 Glycerol-3-phosphate dehydrogenase [NAD(P)+] [Calycomorphotria hydatis]
MTERITVLGGGAMGTACASLLADKEVHEVRLWVREPELAQNIAHHHENSKFLSGVLLPESIHATSDAAEALDGASLVVAAVPCQYLRGTLDAIRPYFSDDVPFASVIKGIENTTFLRPSEVICDVLGDRNVASLSGPSHAEEIVRHLPASVVAACGDVSFCQYVQELFTTDRFRVYTNRDIVGVELAAALKNVIAIAAGISDGLGYGDNAKSALVTRGMVEMTRFGMKLGAEASSFAGLAGMGDLITTCFSRHSRNRKLGDRLGQGESLAQIQSSVHSVAEGVATALSVYEYADEHDIDMPITSEVYAVLYKNKSARDATDALMTRPLKEE